MLRSDWSSENNDPQNHCTASFISTVGSFKVANFLVKVSCKIKNSSSASFVRESCVPK